MTLSGRVDTLEAQVTFIVQDLLQKIDLVSSSSQAIQWNQQFDSVEDTVINLKNQIQSLQSLYTNLYITTQNNYAAFTGHTGQTGHGS